MEIDVDAVCRSRGLALMSDGNVAQITDWFDADGDECEPQDATCCVAKLERARDTLWLTIDLTAFETTLGH